MTAGIRVRRLLAAVALSLAIFAFTAWLLHVAGLPDLLVEVLAIAAGLAMWRSPPLRPSQPLALQPPGRPPAPALDVGVVTFAPPELGPVVPQQRFWLGLGELQRHATLIGTT